MADDKKSKLPGFLSNFLEQLRSSHLVMLLTAIWALDMLVPDPLPFVDEVILGLLTLLVARFRSRGGTPPESPATRDPPAGKPPPKNVTPPS